MNDEKAKANQVLPPLWQYVHLDQFSRPTAPTREAVRKGLSGLWQRMFRAQPSPEEVVAQKELYSLPRETLEQAAASPDWTEPVSALGAALAEWLDKDRGEFPAQVVVGMPYGGIPEVLVCWASVSHWEIIRAPEPEEILTGGSDWLSAISNCNRSTLLIPRLEGCYLRHHNGLELIRKLLDWLWTGRARCLIGCDSWAWSYLTKAVRIESILPTPLTLDAFDGSRLQRWFPALAARSGRQPFIFRQADSGELVLPLTGDQPAEQKGGESGSDLKSVGDFLANLAAHSCGIPGVAWSIWRHSLRFAKQEEIKAKAKQIASEGLGRTLWVTPWSQIRLPVIPDFSDHHLMLLLHALLLHNGLPVNLLPQVLPLFRVDVLSGLQRLRRAGVVEEAAGRWRVTGLSYPGVRQFLATEGYLIDPV